MSKLACAHCRTPLGAAYLLVHDATGGPTGAFCSGSGQRCYLDALKQYDEAEPADVRRLHGDLETLERAQACQISLPVRDDTPEAPGASPNLIGHGRSSHAHPRGLLHPTAYFDALTDRPVSATGASVPGKSRRVARRRA